MWNLIVVYLPVNSTLFLIYVLVGHAHIVMIDPKIYILKYDHV